MEHQELVAPVIVVSVFLLVTYVDVNQMLVVLQQSFLLFLASNVYLKAELVLLFFFL